MEIDRTHPERYPAVFQLGQCGACARCYLDKRTWRCDCGGPFNSNLERDPQAFRLLAS